MRGDFYEFLERAPRPPGAVLVIAGWKQTGQLSGLGLMILGVALLLAALMVYNKPFESGSKGL